jgi:hypothetical protein
MRTFTIKAIGGAEFTLECEDLLDLHTQINLTLMNELGWHLDELESIEEKIIKPNIIMVCEDCKTESWTAEDTHGNPITNHAGKDAYCFKCDDFAHVIEIEEVDNG